MFKKNQKKILFFISGPTPTDEEIQAAEKINERVMFRNAAFVTPDLCEGQIESCDGVAGCAPEPYVVKYGKIGNDACEKIEPKPKSENSKRSVKWEAGK